jgi:hypothetical protein
VGQSRGRNRRMPALAIMGRRYDVSGSADDGKSQGAHHV